MYRSYFGVNNHQLNLREMSLVAETELIAAVAELGIDARVSDFKPVERIPGKGYSGRGEARVSIFGKPLGSGVVYVVLFKPEDGTGSHQDFDLSPIPYKFTPRKKIDYAELFLSLGTGYDDFFLQGNNHLRELTLDENRAKLVDLNDLTLDEREWGEALRNRRVVEAQRFIFIHHEGRNYGNPHAVIFSNPKVKNFTQDGSKPFFQLGAFLSFPERTKDLERIERRVYDEK